MNILVTGSAGFIGFHVCMKLLTSGHNVYGIDNLNKYYDVNLKKNRLNILKKFKNFHFKKIDIQNINNNKFFNKVGLNLIINLAAQAGVRLSKSKPDIYLKSNVDGFLQMVLFAKSKNIKKFIYASSSSVYGDLLKKNLSENKYGKAKSFYGLTKQFNEKIADFYSDDIMFIGLRFFTVYGPFGRPDMAVYKFTQSIYNNDTVELYNKGKNLRDYTFIDDLVYIIYKIINSQKIFTHKNNIFNIGFSKPISTNKLLSIIQNQTNKNVKRKYLPQNKLDLVDTKASTIKINKYFGKINSTKIEQGIEKFLYWYKNYYGTN